MAAEISPIIDYFASIGVEGLGIYAYDRAIRELKKQPWMVDFIKSTKQYFEAAMDVIISVLIYFALRYTIGERLPVLVYRAVRAGGSFGVYDAFAVTIKDKPKVVITDAKTVEAFNLDPNANVSIYVDGSAVSLPSPVTTDGNGYAKITLPSALSEGVHKVLVHSGFRAAFTEQYVKAAAASSSATAAMK